MEKAYCNDAEASKCLIGEENRDIRNDMFVTLKNDSINEINETKNGSAKKKFIVTKLLVDPSTSPRSLFNEDELFKNNLQATPKQQYSKSCMVLSDGKNCREHDIKELRDVIAKCVDSNDENYNSNNNNNNVIDFDYNREIEDEFNVDEVFGIDFDANGNRYAEGEDTITSLKNSVYLNKLNEIKRNAALKKAKSATSSASQGSSSDGSSSNNLLATNEIPATPQSKRALFQRSESSLSITSSSRKHLPIMSRRGSRAKTISESTTMNAKSEELINTLEEIIKDDSAHDDRVELKKKLLKHIEENQNLENRKRKFMKNIFKTLACFFILFTFIMGSIVLISLIIHINEINYVSNNITMTINGTLVDALIDLLHKKPSSKI